MRVGVGVCIVDVFALKQTLPRAIMCSRVDIQCGALQQMSASTLELHIT